MICIIHNAVKPTCKQIKKYKILKILDYLITNGMNIEVRNPHNK